MHHGSWKRKLGTTPERIEVILDMTEPRREWGGSVKWMIVALLGPMEVEMCQ